MLRRQRTTILALGLIPMAVALACSGGNGSPVSPSLSDPGNSTIRGTALTAAPGPSTRSQTSNGAAASARPMGGHPAAMTRVCVSGTTNCATVNDAGKFEISGPFSGDVHLEFTSQQGAVVLTIPNVQAGETIVVRVELSGSTGVVRIESRQGDDDDSADDDSAADDDSSDDDSADDDDSSDDDSADDDSADDDDSKDDDSKD